MQQEISKKRKIGAAIFWLLTIACMGVIFYFSSRTADESSVQSEFILKLLTSIFGENAFTEFVVRKIAHFSEFAGLSLLTNSAMYFSKGKKSLIASTAIVSLYAVTDEIHQIFVEGRACQFVDWSIDTAGAILGTIVFWFIILVFTKTIYRHSKEK